MFIEAIRNVRKRPIPWRTLPIRVASPFVYVFMSYLIIVNAMLASGGAKVILNHLAPAHAHFEWRTAYSPWFFHVRTTGFVFRGEDSSVQWLFTFDRASVTFDPLAFASRRVHMHDARASGISLRIRFKIDPKDATPEYTSALPPIPGFSDPPLTPAVRPPPITDDNYILWSVQLDDAVGEDLREAWLDTMHLTDVGGSAAGGFYFRPLRIISMRPSVYEPLDASVARGTEVIVSHVHGTIGFAIAKLDVQTVVGSSWLSHVDVKERTRGEIGDLRVLTALLHSAPIAFAGGRGPFESAISMQRGALVDGSRAELRSESWSAWAGHDWLTASSRIIARVQHAHVEADAKIDSLAVHRDKATSMSAPVVFVHGQDDDPDLTHPIERWILSIDAPAVSASDLRAFDGYFDAPLFHSGSAHASAHADITPAEVSGHGKIEVTGATWQVGETTLTASGTAEATLHHFDRHTHRGDVTNARAELHDVAGGGRGGWSTQLTASPLSFSLAHDAGFATTIVGKCKDAQVPLAIARAPGIVSTIFGAQPFTVSANTRVAGSAVDISDVRILGDSIEAYGRYRARGAATDGLALVEASITNVGVVLHDGRMSLTPFASREWYDRRLRENPRASK